jgi:hypothetical protein
MPPGFLVFCGEIRRGIARQFGHGAVLELHFQFFVVTVDQVTMDTAHQFVITGAQGLLLQVFSDSEVAS